MMGKHRMHWEQLAWTSVRRRGSPRISDRSPVPHQKSWRLISGECNGVKSAKAGEVVWGQFNKGVLQTLLRIWT